MYINQSGINRCNQSIGSQANMWWFILRLRICTQSLHSLICYVCFALCFDWSTEPEICDFNERAECSTKCNANKQVGGARQTESSKRSKLQLSAGSSDHTSRGTTRLVLVLVKTISTIATLYYCSGGSKISYYYYYTYDCYYYYYEKSTYCTCAGNDLDMLL